MIVLIILASLVGFGAMQLDKIDPDNYVKMYLGQYVVEVKVLGLIMLLILVAILMYFTIWLIKFIWRSPNTLSNWQHSRNRDKADEQFGAGYLSLIKGDWLLAEKQLLSNSNHSHNSYVNYLAAARAAQQQGRYEQRDSYLESAYAVAPKEKLAISLTKAKLHVKAGQLEYAQATLDEISELGKDNPQYTAMLIEIYQQNNNWHGIQNLMPLAKKQKALPKQLLANIQNEIHLNSLMTAKDKSTAWKKLPKEQRKLAANIEVYAQSLVDSGDISAAEKLIRKSLKQNWSDRLVDSYGQLSVDKPEKLLRVVKGWLLEHADNAHLNLAAGRLANASKSYETAKQHLQSAISNGPLPEAYRVLGEIFEANNETAKALQMYRIGMQAFVDSNADQAQVGTTQSSKVQQQLIVK